MHPARGQAFRIPHGVETDQEGRAAHVHDLELPGGHDVFEDLDDLDSDIGQRQEAQEQHQSRIVRLIGKVAGSAPVACPHERNSSTTADDRSQRTGPTGYGPHQRRPYDASINSSFQTPFSLKYHAAPLLMGNSP